MGRRARYNRHYSLEEVLQNNQPWRVFQNFNVCHKNFHGLSKSVSWLVRNSSELNMYDNTGFDTCSVKLISIKE